MIYFFRCTIIISAISYFRLVHRLTKNEITEITGVTFYLLANGTRPVTLHTIIKWELVFGVETASNLVNFAWQKEGEWTVEALAKRILSEQVKWDKEERLI